jgi:hypothetical protein
MVVSSASGSRWGLIVSSISGCGMEKSPTEVRSSSADSSSRGNAVGEVVLERGRFAPRLCAGEIAGSGTDLVLCGVEFAEEDDGEDIVRDRDGVRVRGMALRWATFRYLSNGEGCIITVSRLERRVR